MEITGLKANLLLFALDKLLGVDIRGRLKTTYPGYSLTEVQYLRDRLFNNHEHPKEEDEEDECG
jgi:hypothetical protein